MTDQPPAVPAGWYPQDDGSRRYWTGSEWLDIPDPDRVVPADVNLGTTTPQAEAFAGSGSSNRSRMSPQALVVIGVVVVIAAVGLFALLRPKGASGGSGDTSVISTAFSTCSLAGKPGATLGDSGATLTLDTKGEEDATGLSVTDLACALAAVKTPDSVISNMDGTRALDGTQTAKWNGITATWRYHPNTGFEVVLTTN